MTILRNYLLISYILRSLFVLILFINLHKVLNYRYYYYRIMQLGNCSMKLIAINVFFFINSLNKNIFNQLKLTHYGSHTPYKIKCVLYKHAINFIFCLKNGNNYLMGRPLTKHKQKCSQFLYMTQKNMYLNMF